MLPKETRECLAREIKTLTTAQIGSLRENILSIIREAEGFSPVTGYDERLPSLSAS
jgi:hypothetical protein